MAAIDPAELVALRQRVAELSSEQRERLREKIEAQGISWEEICPAELSSSSASERPERLPLTPSQAHVWVLHQLYPELSAYHIAFAWCFEGKLEVKAVSTALQSLVDRHEGLRTVFRQGEDGQPFQVLLEEVRFECEGGDGGEDWVKRPFDLVHGPLLRAELNEEEAGKWRLRLVLHHLIADGWSRGVLMRDFVRFYRAAIGLVDEAAARSDEELSRLNFETYESDQEWRASAGARDELSYWKRRLEGLRPLELPLDWPRPSDATFESRMQTRTLPPHLNEAMHALAKRAGASFFMVLLGAFKFLLHRYSGERDLALGVPVAGRRAEESRELIGFFVNTLVLRTKFELEPEATFIDWVRCVKETVLGGLAHQFVPFSQVVEACASERTSHRNPLFEVMFQVQSDGYSLQNAESPDVALPGLSLRQEPVPLQETKFDLTWHLFEREEGSLLAVEYRSALFSDARIERLMAYFENLLECLAKEAERPLYEVDFLGTSERANLLRISQGDKGLAGAGTFIESFTNQVREKRDAIAVRSGDQVLSYKELECQASALASWLLRQGLQRGERVGLSFSRSPGLLVAILGVMKAGGAYVPIDPELPEARRTFLREDSGCALVLNSLPELEEGDEEVPPPSGDDLCYLLYTSGSTGKPKGVAINHGGLMHYLRWAVLHYPYEQGWGAPVQSSIGFDATITSLLGPLMVGKTVQLLPDEEVIEPLVKSMISGPGVVKVTPAHLLAVEPFLRTDLSEEQVPKALVIGGEALTDRHVDFWRKHYPSVKLFNEYGPTETVVGCCVHEVIAEDVAGGLPIGRPIAGTQLYVLNEELSLQPTGVPGELYISGDGVAQGYHGRPSLTAEKFLPNPFSQKGGEHGEVMYRTGDRVRFREDGLLEYLGRMDEQLQLRGYRIEPAEIELALRQQEGLREAAVVERRGQLVAFVSGEFDELRVKVSLQKELPAYMVPGIIQVLEEFPLTANGKVDRLALPDLKIVQSDQEIIAPRTEREEILLRVWQEVLGHEGFGVEDNFFEQGGDSIMAMQIIAGARREGLSLTPTQLFEHQTIVGLAQIARDQAEEAEEIVAGEVPLSSLQLAFLESEPTEPGHFHQGLVLKVNAEVDLTLLEAALREVVGYHDAFRLRMARGENGQWEQDYGVDTGEVIFEVVDRPSSSVEMVKRQGPFDLKSGPLTKAVVFRGEEGICLWWQAHHFIVDGLSWRILLEDLETIYGQLARNEAVKFSQKTTSLSRWWREYPAKQVAGVFGDRANRWTWDEAEEFSWEIGIGDHPVKEVEVLGTLAQAYGEFLRVSELPVSLERHGRQHSRPDLDVTRTVGWFTSLHFLLIALPGTGLDHVLRQLDGQLNSLARQDSGGHQVELSFNYLGRLTMPSGSLLQGLAAGEIPEMNHPKNGRSFPLELVAWIEGERLKIRFRWHRALLAPAAVEQIAQRQCSLFESLLEGAVKPKVILKKDPNLSKLMSKLKSRDGTRQ